MALVNLQDLEEPEDWEGERKKVEVKKPHCLRAYIYRCRNLPAVDNSGLLDPQVHVRFCGSSQKTSVFKQTANPDYFECLEFNVMLPEALDLGPNILIQVWDNKRFNETPVGSVRFPVGDCHLNKKMLDPVKPPTWLPLTGIGKES